MISRRLAILLGLGAGAAIGIAWFTLPPLRGAGLGSQLGAVRRLEVGPIILTSSDARSWQIASAANAPAKPEPVRRFLLALSRMARGEDKSADPARYEALGLGKTGVRVRALAADGSVLADYLLGSPVEGQPGARYARQDMAAQSFIAQDVPELPRGAFDWADLSLPAIDPSRVDMILLTGADLSNLRLERGPDEQLRLLDSDAPLNQARADDLAAALNNIAVADMSAAGERFWRGAATFFFRLKGGLDVSGQVTQTGPDEAWLRLNGYASATADADIRDEADHINALKAYAFRIAPERAALLASSRADLQLRAN
jgi:hypothetical protein